MIERSALAGNGCILGERKMKVHILVAEHVTREYECFKASFWPSLPTSISRVLTETRQEGRHHNMLAPHLYSNLQESMRRGNLIHL